MRQVLGVVVSRCGHFFVTDFQGRNFLYSGVKGKLAECINGDYESRHGGLRGWLRKVQERELTRARKLVDKRHQVEVELDETTKVITEIEEELNNA